MFLNSRILEVNAKYMISGGALWELVRISRDCSRDDIRILAQRTLSLSPTFQAELKRLRVDYSWTCVKWLKCQWNACEITKIRLLNWIRWFLHRMITRSSVKTYLICQLFCNQLIMFVEKVGFAELKPYIV